MSPTSFGKREREKKQQERAAQKRQRRADRAQERSDEDQPDSTELLERFRLLSESFASGAVDRDTYEAERREIYAQLGLTDAFDD